ncbi:MAG: hypothetical protein J7M12_03695 [Candidatus Hydrogenedentes bacterium]|nr:hypothetical protein [Candidatus Hydrogenedentota bacterium]
MDILIDGEPAAFSPDRVGTLGDMFEFVDQLIATQNRCVTCVKIDGVALSMDKMSEAAFRSVDDIESVEFITQSSDALVEDLLGELASQIDELGELVRAIAAGFQDSTTEPPLETLPKMVDAWQSVIERLATAADLLRISLDNVELPDGDTAGQHHARLSETLTKLTSAVENRDYVLVADLLEYEIAPGIEREISVLTSLRNATPHTTD